MPTALAKDFVERYDLTDITRRVEAVQRRQCSLCSDFEDVFFFNDTATTEIYTLDRSPVEVSVGGQNEPGGRVSAVHAILLGAKAVERGQCSRGNSEDGAAALVTARSAVAARGGHPIEVTIPTLNE
jgi:hypothetical protein